MAHKHFKALYENTNKHLHDIGPQLLTSSVHDLVPVHDCNISDSNNDNTKNSLSFTSSVLSTWYAAISDAIDLVYHLSGTVSPVHDLRKKLAIIYSVSYLTLCRLGVNSNASVSVQIYRISLILSISPSSQVTLSMANVTSIISFRFITMPIFILDFSIQSSPITDLQFPPTTASS